MSTVIGSEGLRRTRRIGSKYCVLEFDWFVTVYFTRSNTYASARSSWPASRWTTKSFVCPTRRVPTIDIGPSMTFGTEPTSQKRAGATASHVDIASGVSGVMP